MTRGFVALGVCHSAATGALIVGLIIYSPALRERNAEHRKRERQKQEQAAVARIAQQHRLSANEDAAHNPAKDQDKLTNNFSLTDAIQAVAAAAVAAFTYGLLRFTKSSWRISVKSARNARIAADAAKK